MPNKQNWIHSGVDLTPVINDPSASVQNTILFTFDDDRAGTGFNPAFLTSTPVAHHIRCIRTDYQGKEWKFARYFNPAGENAADPEYELYDLSDDPFEQTNLYSDSTPTAEQLYLQNLLAQAEAERLQPISSTFLPTVRT